MKIQIEEADLRSVLEKLETAYCNDTDWHDGYYKEAITICEQALGQPAPVAQVRSTEKPHEQQEPSFVGVLLAVEDAIRNGDCHWQIESAFEEYEAQRKAATTREALAEQPAPVAKPHEQQELASASVEPVAWLYDFLNPDDKDEVITDWVTQSIKDIDREVGFNIRPLYTSPPNVPTARASKPWVGLTVDELESGSQIEKAKSGAAIDLSTAFWAGARWAEAKLREKNHG